MIDDLIFFGLEHSIPEEKGIGFLIRMFQAWSRKIQRFVEPLKEMNMEPSSGKTYSPKPLPEGLRKRRKQK